MMTCKALALASSLVVMAGCGSVSPDDPTDVGVDSRVWLDAGPDAAPDAADAGITSCACLPGPHGDLVYVLSHHAELYSFDPVTDQFAFVANVSCDGQTDPYTLAVDHEGTFWMLFVGTRDLRTIAPGEPGACGDPGFVSNLTDFPLFGMSFVGDENPGTCPELFAHSYSGSGPFDEGPSIGALGRYDAAAETITSLASIDYDGGELAGTGDGRLFAFAGVSPAKLVEYDRATGAVVETIPLDGLHKTGASAFAFFGGDLYFFTEAPPPGCDTCLDASCAQAHTDCLADPVCAEHLGCLLASGVFTDECGGEIFAPLLTCLNGPCAADCFPEHEDRLSQVVRFDLDDSEGNGQVLEVVVPEGPIRVVGAGTSPCVPYVPL